MTNTPLVQLDNLYFKREDQNITGSAKDRALPFQVENLKKNGFTQAVISSTGNAAISAAHFCHQENIKLTIFLSPHISPEKLNLLKKYNHEIIFSHQPISDAIKFSKSLNVYLLRQSTDPSSLTGYQKIAEELIEQLSQATSIFIPIGSGTTLLGISQKLSKNVKIFGAQSAANPTISKIFDTDFTPETRLITDALSVKFLPNKDKVINAIKNSSGSCLTIQDEAIVTADLYLKSKNIITSLEGALVFAAYQKAQKNNLNIGQYPVILLTGAKR
jgi:threonine synthase